MTKAIFLDRDGTINPDGGYINHPDDFKLYPFTAKAIKKFNDMGYLVIVVTNQSGIARGYMTKEDLKKIHDKMIALLSKDGAAIDEIFYSPYHPEGTIEPYNVKSDERKPGLGMFYKALKKYKFSTKDSFMIGDKYSDIEFGKNAGLTTILVKTGDGEKEFLQNRHKWKVKPDFVVENLLSAANLIEKIRR
jgi:D-glycero-D-manno-heptose 1,7-bisphosphate phosphatase